MKLIAKDYDPVTGITEEFWHDELNKKITIRRLQDVEDQLSANVQSFNNSERAYGQSPMHHVARIPLALLEKWLREEGFDWFNSTDAERRKRINDNPKLKVRQGRL